MSGAGRVYDFTGAPRTHREAPVRPARPAKAAVRTALPIHRVIAGIAEEPITASAPEQAVVARTTAQHIPAGVPDQSILEATGTAPYRIVAVTAK